MFSNYFYLLLVTLCSFIIAFKLNYKIPGPKYLDDKIAIVGAGAAGVHMAYLLKKKGFTNIEILESNNRIGGKSFSPVHRNIHHELGTLRVTEDYNNTIIALLNEYVPNGLVKAVAASCTLDSSNKFISMAEYIGLINSALLNTRNTSIILAKFLGAAQKYIDLHQQLFGDYDGELMPQPNKTVMNKIRGTYYDYLQRNGLLSLVPALLGTHSMQGYGLLHEVPALYGLMWNTPSLMRSIINLGTGGTSGTDYLRLGFQNLWETIIAKENIAIKMNSEVKKLKPLTKKGTKGRHDIELKYAHKNPVTKRIQMITKRYNFVMWTPEMKQSLALWDFHDPEVTNYFNKTTVSYFTTAITDTQNEARSFSPILLKFTSNHTTFYNNRVTADRNSFSTLKRQFGPNYTNRKFPISNDGSNVSTSVVYQMHSNEKNESDLKKIIVNHKKSLNATNISLPLITQWRYFPRYSTKDIEDGILWKILEIQGLYGIWYLGSSVSFESAKSVAEYNELLFRNMEEVTKSTAANNFNVNIFLFAFSFVCWYFLY